MNSQGAKPLAGRVCVVTGATRGIGWSAAVELARRGAHVVAVGRTIGALEELDDAIKTHGDSATLVQFDLKDVAAIDRLGAAIYERWGRLDGLVANAGLLGAITPLGHLDPKVWDDVMAVNVTANWRLIRSLDPLLRQSDAGRAVFLSSGAAHACKPFWGVYSVSKAALDALVRTYSGELISTKVKANLFSPGPVRTAMRAKAMPGEDPLTLPHPDELAPAIVDLVSPDCIESGRIYDFRQKRFLDFNQPD